MFDLLSRSLVGVCLSSVGILLTTEGAQLGRNVDPILSSSAKAIRGHDGRIMLSVLPTHRKLLWEDCYVKDITPFCAAANAALPVCKGICSDEGNACVPLAGGANCEVCEPITGNVTRCEAAFLASCRRYGADPPGPMNSCGNRIEKTCLETAMTCTPGAPCTPACGPPIVFNHGACTKVQDECID